MKKVISDVSSMGGQARAASLTPEERSEIARNAVQARWNRKKTLTAAYTGKIHLGDIEIDCAVLDNGTRVLSDKRIAHALSVSRSGSHWEKKRSKSKGAILPVYLDKKELTPYINKELEKALLKPILYVTEQGREGHGVKAELLPEICNVWLSARDDGVLKKYQHRIVTQADIIMRGLATVGITALIDEATGYQLVREKGRKALEKILNEFIAKELRKWTKTFPDEYYEQIFRLKKWDYPPRASQRPGAIAQYTNDIVYDRLAPGVLQQLKKINPSDGHGNRKQKHHQLLTEKVGEPKLREHLSAVVALMKASSSWEGFNRLLSKALPSKNTNLELFEEEEPE